MKKTTLVSIIVTTMLIQTSFAEKNFLSRLFQKVSPSPTSAKICTIAKSRVGTSFRPGVTKQCANFVGDVVTKAGGTKPSSPAMARSWLKWGKPVSWSSKKPGDLIITYRGRRSGTAGHILIYAGNNVAVHRPTSKKQVSYIDVDYYASRVLGVRRAA